jgi:hypothetical protein
MSEQMLTVRTLETLREHVASYPKPAELRCCQSLHDAIVRAIPVTSPPESSLVGCILGSAFGVEFYVYDGLPSGVLGQWVERPHRVGEVPKVVSEILTPEESDRREAARRASGPAQEE